jgi:hypothetical protein
VFGVCDLAQHATMTSTIAACCTVKKVVMNGIEVAVYVLKTAA